jgi:hypothetical protein
MASALHPLEARIAALIAQGRDLTSEDLGGIERIQEHAAVLGVSPLMPDILQMLFRARDSEECDGAASIDEVATQLLGHAVTDLALCDAVDAIDAARPLDKHLEERCFEILLGKAERTVTRLTGLARRFALEGAFRLAVGTRRRELQLLAHLLGVESDDDPYYLAGAARIAGVAYAHWKEQDLVALLESLTTVPEACATARFELGMAKLSQALERQAGVEDASPYLAALTEFQLASEVSGLEAEARLYADCLALIRAFHDGTDSQTLRTIHQSIRMSAFQMTAMHGKSTAPSWLGARHAEATCWHALVTRLTSVVEELDQPSWWNPQVMIEQHLMTAYCASRSILFQGRKGGIEGLIRPRIERQMATKEGLVHQLKMWIEQNASHDLRPDADMLVSQIDALVHSRASPTRPSEAAPDWSSIAAFIDRTAAPDRIKQVFLSVLASAIALNMENMSAAALSVIEKCHSAVESHPDYKTNPHAVLLFNTALYWTVQFVLNRLELTQKDDPSLSYLFEREDGSLATEDALQDDYYRFLSTYAAGTDLEPMNIGGGRADLRMRSSGERLVIEVKREERDCSFDGLTAAYAAQTTDYQNVSIRLGFLLVLDQCVPNLEGTPHISSLFEPKPVVRTGEALPRAIVIVRIPGRRRRPSDLTRLAQPKRRRGKS